VPTDSFRPGAPEVLPASRSKPDGSTRAALKLPEGTDPALAPALTELMEADPAFEPARFVTGAKAAYRMILEAFWSSNSGTMEGLVSDEVQENFAQAIEAREGVRLPNKIISIDAATITATEIIGQMAEVTVRFVSRIGATGADIAGETADIWTFSRHITSLDPAWLLIATDAEA
jgi:predicted lipid-binding transport protein (Tim44 family)